MKTADMIFQAVGFAALVNVLLWILAGVALFCVGFVLFAALCLCKIQRDIRHAKEDDYDR